MATATTALPPVPAEVLDLVKKEGAEACLIPVVEMTRQVFSEMPIAVVLDIDPEIPDDRHVCFEIDTTAIDDPDRLYNLHRQWVEKLFDVCPSTHVCVFRTLML